LGFARLWRLPLEPLDDPNTGRTPNGWSKVSLLKLKLANGGDKRFIVKRQQDHASRTFRHPLQGIPTLRKEFSTIRRCERRGLPCAEAVYYAERFSRDGQQAILITDYLEGYVALDRLARDWQKECWPERRQRKHLLKMLALVIRRFHREHLQHNCLYPQHMFVNLDVNESPIRLIDLEKTRLRLGGSHNIRDLETLHRRSEIWTRTDRLYFLKTYCGVERLDRKTKRLARRILKRYQRKV
jgi:hypothetical protein